MGSGVAAVPLQLGGVVKEIIEAPDLDRGRRGDPRQLVNAALSGITRYTLPESVRDDYLASYQGNRFAESLRYLRSYPAELPVLAGPQATQRSRGGGSLSARSLLPGSPFRFRERLSCRVLIGTAHPSRRMTR